MTARELERLLDLLAAAAEQEWADEHALRDDIGRLRGAIQEELDRRTDPEEHD